MVQLNDQPAATVETQPRIRRQAVMHARYAATAQPRLSKAGDISVRSAQTIHRGTANLSSQPRPVLVLGVDAPGSRRAIVHEQQVTRLQYASLPAYVRQHLVCRVVDRLEPVVQQPRIDGLTSAAPF